MPKVVYTGHVYPSAAKINFSHPNKLHWKDPHRNLDMDIQLQITNSEVRVTCEGPTLVADSATHLAASDFALSAVNSIAFTAAIGLRLILDKQIFDGKETVILLTEPDLDISRGKIGAAEIFDIILGNPNLFLRMDELIEVLRSNHVAPINCARVIEGLREYIAGAHLSREKQWVEFNRIIRVDKSYSKSITDISTRARHGTMEFTPGPDAMESAKRAFTIMLRVLLLKKRGLKELPDSPEFPLLFG